MTIEMGIAFELKDHIKAGGTVHAKHLGGGVAVVFIAGGEAMPLASFTDNPAGFPHQTSLGVLRGLVPAERLHVFEDPERQVSPEEGTVSNVHLADGTPVLAMGAEKRAAEASAASQLAAHKKKAPEPSVDAGASLSSPMEDAFQEWKDMATPDEVKIVGDFLTTFFPYLKLDPPKVKRERKSYGNS